MFMLICYVYVDVDVFDVGVFGMVGDREGVLREIKEALQVEMQIKRHD